MRRWIVVFISLLVISILLDLFLVVGEGHDGFPWSHIAGFFALFGFIGCLVLMGVAKLLGHYWLEREEDYYGKNDDDE